MIRQWHRRSKPRPSPAIPLPRRAKATPRDRFLEAAQRELAAFEQREREFTKRQKQERAAELQIPTIKNEFHG